MPTNPHPHVSAYNGLPMRCSPGTHETAFEMIMKRTAARDSVLDVAAGSGALLARLRDAGFIDLNALELDIPKFGVPGITPLSLDLDRDFAAPIGRRFKLITAIEIIEHLQSPHHFLSQLHALLEDGGHLIISTPNIANWIGRLKFLLRGELRYFDESQYRYNHHISPMSDTLMRLIMAEVGHDLVAVERTGSFFSPARRAILSPVEAFFRLFGGPGAVGDVNIYLTKKGTPVSDNRPGDWSRG